MASSLYIDEARTPDGGNKTLYHHSGLLPCCDYVYIVCIWGGKQLSPRR
jgi:hypothetical protein